MNSTKRLKMISVSSENYQILKELGQTADSFNDVITRLIKATENSDINNKRQQSGE